MQLLYAASATDRDKSLKMHSRREQGQGHAQHLQWTATSPKLRTSAGKTGDRDEH